MPARNRTSDVSQFHVLYSSARRCCVCFALNHDYSEKKGQLAHLDCDPSNSLPDNLAWLCLDHHDAYDTRTSQSKGYSEPEVRRYRQVLYEEVTRRREPQKGDQVAIKEALKNELIEENLGLFFFAAHAMYDPQFREVLLNEVRDPQFREQIHNAWSFLASPASPEVLAEATGAMGETRLDQMAKYMGSSEHGREDLKALLALAGCELCAMSEVKRNEALFSLHDDTIRSALMLIRKIHLDSI